MTLKALKGFKDILPGEVEIWQAIERTARSVFQRFGFSEIKVPIIEKTDLFARSIGETTDIVEKEMYTFEDRNGKMITLRPEGTASVLRAFIEHSLHTKQPVQKLYTMGPMFRHERPQKGRLRQFHQMSVEVLGADQPALDADIMAMAWMVLSELGISASLEINSLGCPACRPNFNKALLDFLEKCKGGLCEDCERRRQKNPLRVLDCKNPQCQERYVNAPSVLDHLCLDCDDHFKATEANLKVLNIPYKINSFMVRGLDYYTKTTFELLTDNIGAQSAIGAGGRYDGLVKQLGGPDIPGIGFAMGMERLVLLLQQKEDQLAAPSPDLFIAALGDKASQAAFSMCHALRSRGTTALMDYAGRSLKNQMKQSGKNNCRFTLIIGEDELANNKAILRDMHTGDQEDIVLSNDLSSWADDLCSRF